MIWLTGRLMPDFECGHDQACQAKERPRSHDRRRRAPDVEDEAAQPRADGVRDLYGSDL
ncbi:hypothetical protein [Methylorubrum extorquens]|uniref:hypothetical protein n=1 Tax=Methylorubrum extorquens TaxID=408 RepID=UPI0003020205|nr:hypothetical protein [Methylorubrum extorquens]MCP1546222.1 hypothetical protein [Methylorubrum extorquens]MCP1590889.1 hypothetical protein [Methylorubrum extorquens]